MTHPLAQHRARLADAANRGANAERAVAKYLRRNGFPHARRYRAGDGRQPGDIDFHPDVCLEVKDVARSAWPTWRAQALAEARPGQLVVVVRRVRGVTDVGQWEAQTAAGGPIEVGSSMADAVWCSRTESSWWRWPLVDIVHHLHLRIPGLEST